LIAKPRWTIELIFGSYISQPVSCVMPVLIPTDWNSVQTLNDITAVVLILFSFLGVVGSIVFLVLQHHHMSLKYHKDQ
jgi:hypothetical protein